MSSAGMRVHVVNVPHAKSPPAWEAVFALREADARLIAAAPTQNDALRQVVNDPGFESLSLLTRGTVLDALDEVKPGGRTE